jgi:hypothetical protein
MTTDRYRSYCQALASIEALKARPAGAEAADLLRESAEDLLLSRDASRDDEDALERAALVLTQLIVIDARTRPLADAIMDALHRSGPQSPVPERELAGSTSAT